MPDSDLTFSQPADLSFEEVTEPPPGPLKGRRPACNVLGISRRLKFTSSERRQAKDIRGYEEALEHVVALPAVGEALHLIMGGEHTALDLILACQHLAREPIALEAATLSMNLGNAGRLLESIDAGALSSARIVVSEFFAANDRDQFNAIQERLAARGQKIVACRNHAKVALLAGKKLRLVIEGSGNLRSCSRVEQATIFNSPSLYDFHAAWIEHLLEHPQQ